MSFFKNVTSGFTIRSRDTILKEALINNLSESVKYIQYSNQYEENFHSILGSTDATNTLCAALEAVFLHGLKDTFLKKAKNALTGDSDQQPQPNFWPLVLVLSHRQNIDQISSLLQINTEIGQCRAWLRIALNECLLSSYMSTLLRNISAVKPFYSKTAFVCDSEILEVAQKLIEGLETCVQFNLPINSSLLNYWPEQVLMLAGIWIPKIRQAPISTALDVASTITDEVKPKLASTPAHSSDITGLGQMFVLNEDEALNIILSKNSEDSISKTANLNLNKEMFGHSDVKTPTNEESNETNDVKTLPVDAGRPSTSQDIADDPPTSPSSLNLNDFVTPTDVVVTGNSLSGKGWSTDNNDEMNTSINSNSSHGSSMIKTPELKSLSSLVDHSNTYGENFDTTPNLRDIMKDIHQELKLTTDDTEVSGIKMDAVTPEDPLLQGLDFEVVNNSVPESFTAQELQKMIQQLGTLSREQGLDYQNYQCKGCQDLLGSTISKAKVCAYTGEYYCSNCMDPNVFIIPARVIHNWDFKRYPVSKKSALFLLEFQHHPWIDMKKLNPKIYCGVSDMAQLQELRIQLNFLRAYIFTCREPVIEELQKRVWPREYLYEHLHLYTILDLAQIPNGTLVLLLEKVVHFAKSHVLDCWLCSQKGFICEVCRDPKILYPFETATTYRCDECSSVFHAKCLNSNIPCPKCKRKQNRTNDPSLVDALHTHFRKQSLK